MAFSPSLYVEAIVILSNNGSFTTVGFTSCLLVFPLDIRYLLPFLEDSLGSILVCSVDPLRFAYILLV